MGHVPVSGRFERVAMDLLDVSVISAKGYICNELGVCQGPISHNNEQTQTVEGII